MPIKKGAPIITERDMLFKVSNTNVEYVVLLNPNLFSTTKVAYKSIGILNIIISMPNLIGK